MTPRAATRTESDRFERWLELIPHCNRAEEGVELAELAGLFEDSAQAILADIQALVDREYYLPGSFADSLTILIDGERLDLSSPDHFQRPIEFSTMEALALQLGLQMIPDDKGEETSATEIGASLASVLKSAADPDPENGDQTPFDAAFQLGPVSSSVADFLDVLATALRNRRNVEIDYYKPYEPGVPTVRRVMPWAVVQVNGIWYLLAHDKSVEEARLFRLDRVLKARVLDSTGDIPGDLRVEDYIDPERLYRASEDYYNVQIAYSPLIARWVEERYGTAIPNETGWYEVTHQCKSVWWAVTQALRHGAEARIQEAFGAGLMVSSLSPLADF